MAMIFGQNSPIGIVKIIGQNWPHSTKHRSKLGQIEKTFATELLHKMIKE